MLQNKGLIQVGIIKRPPELTKDNCKTCQSPFRKDIEAQRLVEGLSYEKLTEYVNNKYGHLGFSITLLSLRNHFMKHVNETTEIKARYHYEQQKVIEGRLPDPNNNIEVQLYNLKKLDDSIETCHMLGTGAALLLQDEMSEKIQERHRKYDTDGNEKGWKVVERVKFSPKLYDMFKGCMEELRHSQKAKAEIIGMDDMFNKQHKKDNIIDAMYNMIKEANAGEDGEDKEVEFDD